MCVCVCKFFFLARHTFARPTLSSSLSLFPPAHPPALPLLPTMTDKKKTRCCVFSRHDSTTAYKDPQNTGALPIGFRVESNKEWQQNYLTHAEARQRCMNLSDADSIVDLCPLFLANRTRGTGGGWTSRRCGLRRDVQAGRQ